MSHMVYMWLCRGKSCQVSMAVQQQGDAYNRKAMVGGKMGDNDKGRQVLKK